MYAHLSEILVEAKRFVEKGELIGLVGNTGNSSSPHLHFEVVFNRLNNDPAKTLKDLKP